jgi:hypothetical protein
VPPRTARARAAELRDLAAAKATDHQRARAGGRADIVVLRTGESARGLTEDYLDVALGAGAPPRACRYDAVLVAQGIELRAEAAAPDPS